MSEPSFNDFDFQGFDEVEAEIAARILEPGKYRVKVERVDAVREIRQAIPHQRVVFHLRDQDTGRAIVRDFRLTDRDGNLNKMQLKILGECMIRSGMKLVRQMLDPDECEACPMVYLVVEEKPDSKGVVRTNETFAKCDDQRPYVGAPVKPATGGASEAPF